MTVQLRPHQEQFVRAVHADLREVDSVCGVAPTGFGKRYLAVNWCSLALQRQRKVLVVTDRIQLVKQMLGELRGNGIDAGVIMSGYRRVHSFDVQVGIIQTIGSRYLETGFGLPKADLLIVDECHKEERRYAKLFSHYPSAKKVGLTATPVGASGRSIVGPGKLFERMVETTKNSWLINNGWLLSTTVFAPSEPDVQGVKINNGKEYSQKQLSKKVQSVTAFADLWQEFEPYCHLKTICFAPGVAYCYGLAQQFNEKFGGGYAEVIEGKTKPEERERILDEFNGGNCGVLVSVDVLKEGFDAPIASCAIDLQTNNQIRTYWQKVGRIKRTHGEQRQAVLIDMAGNFWRHIHPDEDPQWDEYTTDTKLAEPKKSPPARCRKCGYVFKERSRQCPNCGDEFKEKDNVRMVRMGNGKLQELPLEVRQAREKSDTERRLDKWKSELYAGRYARRTLRQCNFLYYRRHGEWPPNGAPFVPSKGSQDWDMRVSDIPARDIETRFKEAIT